MNTVIDIIKEYIEQGGFVMIPLVVSAAILWYGLGYRMLLLRRGSNRNLKKILRAYYFGHFQPKGFIGRAIEQGVRVRANKPKNLAKSLDLAFFELDLELRQFAALINAIVIAAPLAGLLGTVAGMVQTFDALGSMELFSQSGGIADGVSQALISTQMGLAVAIPGFLVGKILTRREHLLSDELKHLKHLLSRKEIPI